MFKFEDIRSLPMDTPLLIKRKYANKEIKATFGGIAPTGTIYVYIDNEKGQILTPVTLEEIIDILPVAQDITDPIIIKPRKAQKYGIIKYNCLHNDGPVDCDCCEGYDSRVCPPVATQYKELRKKYNEFLIDHNYC